MNIPTIRTASGRPQPLATGGDGGGDGGDGDRSLGAAETRPLATSVSIRPNGASTAHEFAIGDVNVFY